MARIILKPPKGVSTDNRTDSQGRTRTGFVSERDLLKKRSAKYVKLLTSLDNSTLTETQGMKELIEAINEEFGVASLVDLPLGIVAKCFLGPPFEVHTLDLSATQIIHHYKVSEPMPGLFERARSLAIHNAYCIIEVYKDKLICIREDGSTVAI